MRSLPTLLKLAQRRIDALAVEAARAMEEIDALVREGEASRVQAGREVALGAESLETTLLLPAYTARLRIEAEQRKATIAGIEQVLTRVRAGLMEAYREKSKFEQLIAREAERLAAEETQREQAALDEAAISRAAANRPGRSG
jgi:flagellar export protein FliJ